MKGMKEGRRMDFRVICMKTVDGDFVERVRRWRQSRESIRVESSTDFT
jgi:hypothetical protein